MGVWGINLYSGDFAMDLRSTIGAVARLPFDANRLVEILSETESAAANNPLDEDHTNFWLVLADQFAKRGIISDHVRAKALSIIDNDENIAMLERLGMKSVDVRKRRKVLYDLRDRITGPVVEKARTVLKKPQPLVMDVGDIVVYPTCYGKNINPYFPSEEQDKQYTKEGPIPWTQNDWGAMVIVGCGRAFDFLSWYRPLVIVEARGQKPTVDALTDENVPWRLDSAGTCSPSHFRKMEMEKIGSVSLDPAKIETVFPGLRAGISAAVSDISIANRMHSMAAGSMIAGTIEALNPRRRATIAVGIGQLLRA
jgi:hypothetical protein